MCILSARPRGQPCGMPPSQGPACSPQHCGPSAGLVRHFAGSRRDLSRTMGCLEELAPNAPCRVSLLLIKRARLSDGTRGLGEGDDSWRSSREVRKENVQELWLGLLAPGGAELPGLSADPREVGAHCVRRHRGQHVRGPGREQA